MSRGMLPTPKINNVTYTTFRYLKTTTKFSDISAFFRCIANYLNIFWGKFCQIMICASMSIQAVLPRVLLVSFAGAPFEVMRSIIEAVPIFVVNFSQFLRIWYKGLSDKTMYQKLMLFFWFGIQRNRIIASANKPGFKQFPSVAALTISWMGVNVSFGGSRVNTCESSYGFHIQSPLYYQGSRLIAS